MNKPKEELLPCPFCGEPGYIEGPESLMWLVGCTNNDEDRCYLAVSNSLLYPSRALAVRIWNTRTRPDSGEGEHRDCGSVKKELFILTEKDVFLNINYLQSIEVARTNVRYNPHAQQEEADWRLKFIDTQGETHYHAYFYDTKSDASAEMFRLLKGEPK